MFKAYARLTYMIQLGEITYSDPKNHLVLAYLKISNHDSTRRIQGIEIL